MSVQREDQTPNANQCNSGLSDLSAGFAGFGNAISSFNRYAVRELQAISDRQKTPPTLPQRMVSSLSLFSAFGSTFKTEKELKEVFLVFISRSRTLLPRLTEEAQNLSRHLRVVFEMLGQIKRLTEEESHQTDEMNVLAELWSMLAQRDKSMASKTHGALLNEITIFYSEASAVMDEILLALTKIRSGLHQFEKEHTAPAAVWRGFPMEMTMDMMSQTEKSLDFEVRRLYNGESDDIDSLTRTVLTTVIAPG